MEREVQKKEEKATERPFFARFLVEQELRSVGGETGYHTMKYPSDDDEFVTLKYPSDDDELTA